MGYERFFLLYQSQFQNLVLKFDLLVSMIKEERNDNVMIACFSKK